MKVGFAVEDGDAPRREHSTCGLDFLRASLLVSFALGYDGVAKTAAKVVGKLIKLGIAINLDGLFGGIANHVAVVTPCQMVFQFSFGAVVEDPIQVVGQFLQKLRALHCLPSPLSRFWK
jgi:hypothetical protein